MQLCRGRAGVGPVVIREEILMERGREDRIRLASQERGVRRGYDEIEDVHVREPTVNRTVAVVRVSSDVQTENCRSIVAQPGVRAGLRADERAVVVHLQCSRRECREVVMPRVERRAGRNPVKAFDVLKDDIEAHPVRIIADGVLRSSALVRAAVEHGDALPAATVNYLSIGPKRDGKIRLTGRRNSPHVCAHDRCEVAVEHGAAHRRRAAEHRMLACEDHAATSRVKPHFVDEQSGSAQ